MSESAEGALELLRNWASKRAVVSLNFVDNSQRRLALAVTARICESKREFIRVSLRPENMGEPPAEFLVLRFDGSETWEEIRDDPLGGIRCLFKRPAPDEDAVLTLLLVPEADDLNPKSVPGEQ